MQSTRSLDSNHGDINCYKRQEYSDNDTFKDTFRKKRRISEDDTVSSTEKQELPKENTFSTKSNRVEARNIEMMDVQEEASLEASLANENRNTNPEMALKNDPLTLNSPIQNGVGQKFHFPLSFSKERELFIEEPVRIFCKARRNAISVIPQECLFSGVTQKPNNLFTIASDPSLWGKFSITDAHLASDK